MDKRIIFHIDVNSAYLSWEAVYRLQQGESLDLRTVPSAVGGNPLKRRGIILAKSIAAKKCGIKTGESLMEAYKKCPTLKIVSPNYLLYMKCSDEMVNLLREYSPKVQRYSIDECFLDYTNMECHFGDPVKTAYEIKNRIGKELGFTVNIGISTNKLLAKMASDFKKPNRVHTLFPEEVPQKMWILPVEDLFMVGRATAPKLHKLNITTIGDLANIDPKIIKSHLHSHGVILWEYANGIENSDVAPFNRPAIKGIGNSTTIPFDVKTREEAHRILLSLTETVGMRLRDAEYYARLISVGIKTSEFHHYSHQHKFNAPTDSTNEIYQFAKELFNQCWKGEPIRQLGIRVSEFSKNDYHQVSLFDTARMKKQRNLDQTIDKIRLRYGSKSIIRGCFLHSGLKPLQGGVNGNEDYPLMSSIL